MPTIYDNIEQQLLYGLFDCLTVSQRSDFCVGYFNLRGWKQVAQHIDQYTGSDEKCCRLLIGMQKAPEVAKSLGICEYQKRLLACGR